MDAAKCLKERIRMCSSLNCCECPLCAENNEMQVNCQEAEKNHTEKAVAIVEKWSAEHPAKTRKSEFLEVYPDAQILENGAIQICPILIEKSKKFNCRTSCDTCRKEYWLSEVE